MIVPPRFRPTHHPVQYLYGRANPVHLCLPSHFQLFLSIFIKKWSVPFFFRSAWNVRPCLYGSEFEFRGRLGSTDSLLEYHGINGRMVNGIWPWSRSMGIEEILYNFTDSNSSELNGIPSSDNANFLLSIEGKGKRNRNTVKIFSCMFVLVRTVGNRGQWPSVLLQHFSAVIRSKFRSACFLHFWKCLRRIFRAIYRYNLQIDDMQNKG